uniref:beta-glucosidase n=1 Tax=Alexandrium andersonii TaxID=327968 RepID=A0A7S2F4B8_9DINO
MLVNVTNNGTANGAEVVQVYFRYLDTEHPTVLKGFYKTPVLEPKDVTQVYFHFNYRDISLFKDSPSGDVQESNWVPQDNLEILVGSSSQDIRGRLTVRTRHE